MAVLHHAFRCPATPEFDTDVARILTAWDQGDLARLSAMALDGYALLADRVDLHAAFLFYPEGPVLSWMQPDFVSPGLAALAILGAQMIEVPNLSARADTNHYLLQTQLPQLGWTGAEIAQLVGGPPVEAMLQSYGISAHPIAEGGFRDTGGWTTGRTAQSLKARIDELADGPPAGGGEKAVAAWQLLTESGALADAKAMLAGFAERDWLVMAVTH